MGDYIEPRDLFGKPIIDDFLALQEEKTPLQPVIFAIL